MKTISALTTALLFTGSVFAADTSPTNQVRDAVAQLKAAANYSWTTTQTIPDMPFTPGPVKGQAEKDGFASISQDMNDNKIEAVLKGDKIVLKNEGQWQLIDDVDGFPAMMAGWMTADGTAADEATKLVGSVKDLTAGDGGVLSGDLTPEGAETLMAFRPRGANAGPTPPAPKNAKGSVKFWLKDGALVKFESHITGTMTMGPDQDEHDMDITRTTEIQDVGTTKVEVPAEAKAKLEPKTDSTKP